MAGVRHISFQVSLFVYMKYIFISKCFHLITCWPRHCSGGCRRPLTAEEHSVQGHRQRHRIRCFPKYLGFPLWVSSASAPLVHSSVMDATWSHLTASLRDTHNSTKCWLHIQRCLFVVTQGCVWSSVLASLKVQGKVWPLGVRGWVWGLVVNSTLSSRVGYGGEKIFCFHRGSNPEPCRPWRIYHDPVSYILMRIRGSRNAGRVREGYMAWLNWERSNAVMFPVLYGSESWSVTLRVFENGVGAEGGSLVCVRGSNRRLEKITKWGTSWWVLLAKYYLFDEINGGWAGHVTRKR